MWRCNGFYACIYNEKWSGSYDSIILLHVIGPYYGCESFRWRTRPHNFNGNSAIVCCTHTEDPEVVQQALLDRLRYGVEDSTSLQDL